MDRRGFLRHGAVGASGLVAGDALRPERRPVAGRVKAMPTDDMDAYLVKIDEGASRLLRWPLADRLPALKQPGFDGEDLARKAMHSLFITGMFGDLPPEQQVHPGMQDRMWDAGEAMDAALDGMTSFLESRTPADLVEVRRALNDRPELLHEIIDTIDHEAELSGVSEPRRAQLRAMFTETGWRLRSQAPELMIDEYLDKVEKVVASDVEDAARQRWLAAKMGEEVFWQAQESLRKRRINRGLKAMGIGALLFLAGLALVSASDSDVTDDDGDALLWLGLVPGITGGSILFVAGLVILLVGAATPEEAT